MAVPGEGERKGGVGEDGGSTAIPIGSGVALGFTCPSFLPPQPLGGLALSCFTADQRRTS